MEAPWLISSVVIISQTADAQTVVILAATMPAIAAVRSAVTLEASTPRIASVKDAGASAESTPPIAGARSAGSGGNPNSVTSGHNARRIISELMLLSENGGFKREIQYDTRIAGS